MTDPTGNEAYTYDALGRVTQLNKTINGVTYPLTYAYDIASDLTSMTYPSGRVVQQGTDSLGRVQQITSSGTNFVSNLAYNAAWQPTGFSYGNGVQAALAYNSRMQLQSLDYALNSQTLFGLNYYYKLDTTNCPYGATGNNGEIQCINDVVDSGRSATYTYDYWNRLSTAATHGSSNYPAWGLEWTYDRYGNRLSQVVTAGTAPSNTVSANATTNRLASPYAYDAAGNTTFDGLNTLTYDGENRATSNLLSGATSTYSFDGNGVRVSKQASGSTTIYVFSGARVVCEYSSGAAPSSPSAEYLYAGTQLVASISESVITYIHPDHLSSRLLTGASGTTLGQQGHYPFGDSWYLQNSTTKWQFTTYERDTDSSNDYALMRSFINRLGRFNTADPMPGLATNPQSLDAYAYSLNDPLNLFDPFGLDPSGPPIGGGVTGVISCGSVNGVGGCSGTSQIIVNGDDGSDGQDITGLGGAGGGTPDRLNKILSETTGANPKAGCPSSLAQTANLALIASNLLALQSAAEAFALAKLTGKAAVVGIGASGGFPLWENLGVSGGASLGLAVDPSGNIALAVGFKYGGGYSGPNAGYTAGVSVTLSQSNTVFGMSGTSAQLGGGGGGAGMGGAASVSISGSVTVTAGAANGVFGTAGGGTTTVVIPLVCR